MTRALVELSLAQGTRLFDVTTVGRPEATELLRDQMETMLVRPLMDAFGLAPAGRVHIEAIAALVVGAGFMRHQMEALAHNTWLDAGPKARFGAFLFGAYKWNPFYEFGGRLDWTQYPVGFTGTETAGSLWITKFITEQTSLRAQYTHAVSPGIHSNVRGILKSNPIVFWNIEKD